MIPKRLLNLLAERYISQISNQPSRSLFRDRTDLVRHNDRIYGLPRDALSQRNFGGIQTALCRRKRENGEDRHGLIKWFITDDEHWAMSALLRADNRIQIDVDDCPLIATDHRRSSAASASADENASRVSSTSRRNKGSLAAWAHSAASARRRSSRSSCCRARSTKAFLLGAAPCATALETASKSSR